jgi:tetratricopeptide (TPR) repeat protein
MELRDELQSALGTTYTLERELGGGGMSRVFTATETALGRRVVIKVLPVELGAGVNVDRFKREIMLAAKLQHPHIVPVLTAGEIDGVPYYTMPFIDGESLRSRLARGTMPIADTINILRDVARALAYAHQHGVVHRDIKPDNVLMSGGSATVADFGIAKAISASRASDARDSMLTSIGMSIGTPAYMAPEQAAADPNTDHRSDIYSFGCLAYELLAGQPPFSGLPPQKLLAAHMGERPRPITELRPDTPPLLADLVMRCLEKDPDARPQSARDVARLLDAVMSTSAESVPAIAFGGPGVLRRALTTYVVAFIAVVILSKAANIGLGVPEWVVTVSIVLMVLALPIILGTAFVQRVARRQLLASPRLTPGGHVADPSTLATLAMKASPYVSWRHAAQTVATGIGGFALLVAVLMVLRPLGIGPLKSLMATGALKDRDKILVADFTAGDDTALGPVVAEAVRADLGQSPVVSVVTPQTVAAALQRMQRASNTRVDTALAREIARREGIKAIVGGDIHGVGSGFIVTMKLVSADSGRELASLSGSADGVKELIPTIGSLTRQLRRRMGESLKHVQASPRLADVTTASLPALQKYTEGTRLSATGGDPEQAITLLKQAVVIDTNFAMAYRALAVALGNRGQDREGQIRYIEKAYAHADRLPEVEHYLATATYWTQGPRPDPAKAAQAYESLLVVHPTHAGALNNLALLAAQRRDFSTADQLLRRAIKANPTSVVAYGNLMTYAGEERKTRLADSMYFAQLAASNDNPRMVLSRFSLLFARGQYDSADAVIDSIANAYPSDEMLQQSKIGAREATSMVRGKLTEGLRLASQSAIYAAQHGSVAASLGATFDSAMVEAWYRGSKEKALQIVNAGLQRTPLNSLPPLERPFVGLARVYSMTGRPDLARVMLAKFDSIAPTMSPDAAAAMRHGINSAIAIAEHRYLDAAHQAQAADVGPCTTCMTPMIAIAYDYAQQPDSAIREFTKYVESTSLLGRAGNDAFFLAAAYKRLGELWEAKGDRQKAARYYTKFLSLWTNADPDLQPKVAEVKRRLARLSDTEAR